MVLSPKGIKWRGATTVALHEFGDSVDTKNIFMTTPMTRTQLGWWKSESCIVGGTNLPASCKESAAETVGGIRRGILDR